MKSIEELFDTAQRTGRLSNEEIAYVARLVEDCRPGRDENLSILIDTLGEAGATQHRELVEKFLHYPSDNWVSRTALQVLTLYWGLTEDYIHQIKDFIRGVPWDDGDVWIVATSEAGIYLREHEDKELLGLVIKTLENPNEEPPDRACAYDALAEAMGEDWLNADWRTMLASQRMNVDMLRRAYMRWGKPINQELLDEIDRGQERYASRHRIGPTDGTLQEIWELYDEAKFGCLTDDEIKHIVECIDTLEHKTSNDFTDLVNLIYTLRDGEAYLQRRAVRQFLEFAACPDVAAAALETLTVYWGFTYPYLNEIRRFVKGVDWDINGDVRHIAMEAARYHLSIEPDLELLRLLLNIYEDEKENECICDSALWALETAVNMPLEKERSPSHISVVLSKTRQKIKEIDIEVAQIKKSIQRFKTQKNFPKLREFLEHLRDLYVVNECPLIECFLNYPQDPATSATALSILTKPNLLVRKYLT